MVQNLSWKQATSPTVAQEPPAYARGTQVPVDWSHLAELTQPKLSGQALPTGMPGAHLLVAGSQKSALGHSGWPRGSHASPSAGNLTQVPARSPAGEIQTLPLSQEKRNVVSQGCPSAIRGVQVPTAIELISTVWQ
jgi:hypothetical protein